MRQVYRAWHMALREQRRATHVQQHKARCSASERAGDI